MLAPSEIESMIRSTGGVQVVVGSKTTYGHRDQVDDQVLGEEGAPVYLTRDVVRVATGILPTLSVGTAIKVAGETLKILDHRRIEDGSLTLIELEDP